MKNLSYGTFREKLNQKAKEKKFPLRAMFELTYRCNFNCVHCYVPFKYRAQSTEHRAEKILDTKQVFSILEQLRDLGCFYLGFTGGEVFLRKDIFKILWYAKRLGFNLIILTNGSLIDKNQADELKNISLNKIDITLHSMNKDNFENITQTKGSFDKVIRAIKLLQRRNIPLGLKNCLLKENKNDIEEVRSFSKRVGAIARLGASVVSRLDGSLEPIQHSGDSELAYQLRRLKPEFSLEPCFVKHSGQKRNVFSCGAGTETLTINPKGEIKICLEIDYPKFNIAKFGLKKAWQKLNKIIGLIEQDDNFKCNTCQLYRYCRWCPARSWTFNKTFATCDPYYRQLAEIQYLKLKHPNKLTYLGR